MKQVEQVGLSKSRIIKGMQCPRALWLSKNPPDFDLPVDPALQAKFASGHQVGDLAQQLFPGGVEVPFEGLSVAEQVAQTHQLMTAGVDVIYEASFVYDGIFVKVDILVRDDECEGDGWQIHEVKMSTSVKPVNLDDVAIQYYVLKGCGLLVTGAYLVHINNQYVRQGEIDVHRLFAGEDVLEEALARQIGLSQKIAALRETLRGDEPTVDIGPHCSDPYECDFIPYCWHHIPANSIFDLSGRGINKFEYYRRGLVRLDDVPLDDLNKSQRFQAESTLNQRDTTNTEAVQAFLDTLWYPLYHLDFETVNNAIPQFDGTRPYQQVPFQYSLHIQDAPGDDPDHCEFISEPGVDPRRQLAEQLLLQIPEDACVLTYNQSFEKSVLRSLAGLFPDLAANLLVRVENVRDLIVPFRKRDVYRWQMAGSYSIKAVLPALVPELSYKGMAVADGQMAMVAFQEMCMSDDPERVAEIRRDLLKYCALDTLGMVRILGELEKIGECPE